MNVPIVLLLIAVVVGGFILLTYNRFVAFRVRIKASIQEIGNQLKRQVDLILNLQESVKGYLAHEKGIFNRLAQAREAVIKAQKSGSLSDAQKASQLISDVLPKIQIVVESNPQLRGAEVVGQLMDELRDTADKVMYARRTLIDLSADYESFRIQFPSNLIANLFGFKEEKGLLAPTQGKHLEVEASELETPKVRL